MRHHRKLALAVPAAAIALGLAAGPVAVAQQQQPAQQQVEVSESKLESFVVAAIAVDDLIQEWEPKISAAEDEQQATQMREQANAEMVAAVEETPGISVQEYQEIGLAARNDPNLATRIRDLYETQTAE